MWIGRSTACCRNQSVHSEHAHKATLQSTTSSKTNGQCSGISSKSQLPELCAMAYLKASQEHDHGPIIAAAHESVHRAIQVVCATLVCNLGIAAHRDQPQGRKMAPAGLQLSKHNDCHRVQERTPLLWQVAKFDACHCHHEADCSSMQAYWI